MVGDDIAPSLRNFELGTTSLDNHILIEAFMDTVYSIMDVC